MHSVFWFVMKKRLRDEQKARQRRAVVRENIQRLRLRHAPSRSFYIYDWVLGWLWEGTTHDLLIKQSLGVSLSARRARLNRSRTRRACHRVPKWLGNERLCCLTYWSFRSVPRVKHALFHLACLTRKSSAPSISLFYNRPTWSKPSYTPNDEKKMKNTRVILTRR